jgi:intracellular septation protein A
MTDPGLILVLGVIAAICVRLFWRQLAELAFVLVLVAVFVGIITLVSQGKGAMGG